jgi:hypothetical protein
VSCRAPWCSITTEHLHKVKAHLLSHPIPSRLAALIQLNTAIRISEHVLARLEDLVLDYDIPHLRVRKNNLTDRKTQAIIRCLPLLGVSLQAAQELHRRAVRQKVNVWCSNTHQKFAIPHAPRR